MQNGSLSLGHEQSKHKENNKRENACIGIDADIHRDRQTDVQTNSVRQTDIKTHTHTRNLLRGNHEAATARVRAI